MQEIEFTQYRKAPLWAEALAYCGMLGLFAASVVTGGAPIWMGVLTGWAMYWNYVLFRLINKYVSFVNASEFSRLLRTLEALQDNKTEDGTISVHEGLTKEGQDERED